MKQPKKTHISNTEAPDEYVITDFSHPQTAPTDQHTFSQKVHSSGPFGVRLKTDQPFSLYYKISGKNTATHMVVYPGSVHYFESSNEFFTHRHNHFELIYVLKGELTNKIDNVSYKYRAGDACLLNRNVSHADIPGANSMIVFINFLDDFIAEILDGEDHFEMHQQPRSHGSVHHFLQSNIRGEAQFSQSFMEFTSTLFAMSAAGPSQAADLIDHIQRELLDNHPGCGYILAGLLCRLLHTLEDPNRYHANVIQLDSSNETILFARICNYLKESHGRISRRELSSALHYHAEYLNQIVKRRSGQSLKQLGKTYMLAAAKQMLAQTDMTIAQIIAALGFTNSSHFYTFFREQTNLSPAQYRKNARTGEKYPYEPLNISR